MDHNDIHVDRALSNFAVEYTNEEYIAQAVAPYVPVGKKSDKYFVYDKKDRFTAPQTIRGPKDEAKEVEWNVSDSDFSCVDHALKDFVPDSMTANADMPITPREKSTETLVDLLLLSFEIATATLATTYANYGASYRIQLSGGDQLDNYSESDPIGVIDTGKAACFKEPNTIIMGAEVWNILKRHPQILDHVKGGATSGDPAKVTLQNLAEIFEVERILVGKAKKNTANKGQTASFSYVWGKDIVCAYIDPQPSTIGVSAWKTFRWIQMSTGEGFQVRTYRDEKRGGGGEVIEPETSYESKAICTDVAYLIDTAIS